MTRWILAALTALLLPASADAFCCMKWDSSCAVANSACVTPVAATPPCPNATFNVECADSSCNPTGPTETPTNTATATVTVTETPSSQAPPDWTGSFVAVWRQNNDWTNDASTTCGATCNMTATNSPTFSNTAGTFAEGTYAGAFAQASNQYASVADNAPLSLTGNLTFGAWIRDTISDAALRSWLRKNQTGGSNGWKGAVDGNNQNELDCYVNNTLAAGASNGVTQNNLRHVACVWNGTNVQPYVSGATSGTATSVTGPLADNAEATQLSGSVTSADWDGTIDEAFVIGTNLSATQICRICSLGISGEKGRCSGSAYLACSTDADCGGAPAKCDTTSSTCQGRNHSDCGGCTLPACDAAAP